MSSVQTEEEINKLKQDLSILYKWSVDWQMLFNVEKCKVMHIGLRNQNTKYQMGGKELSEVTEERDLGVIVSKDLKVGNQCAKAASKGNQILGMISRTFECKNKEIMLHLYKSLVRPHLDYCSQSWRPHLTKDIDVLEKVQRRATRMICEYKDLEYHERLKYLKLTTLETRRLRADLVEVLKYLGLQGVKRITGSYRRIFLSKKNKHYKRPFSQIIQGKNQTGRGKVQFWK